MPTKEEMRSLADEIVRSYEGRVADIASLRDEVATQQQATQVQLRELDRAHQAMARELRADLTKGRSDLASNVASQMRELASAHQAMAWQQRASLGKGRSDLTQAETQRISEVNAWMKEIAGAHQAMAGELRADLTKGRSDLASNIASQMKEVSSAHQAMAWRQRADLGKGRADLTQAEAGRKSGVNIWMNQVATAHAEARNEWQNLIATMQAKRGVPVVEVKPPEVVAPPPVEEVAPPPPVEEIAEEGAMVRAEAADVTPDIAALRDQVFEYLANQADGTRLVELEQEFSLARIQMARIIRSLVDEGKVEKRELLYFAI